MSDATGDDATESPDSATDRQEEEKAKGRDRQDRLSRTQTPGLLNSLQHWTDARNPLRLVINFLAVQVIRYSPVLRLKSWLLRRLGAEVGQGVSLGLAATPDVFWPELIRIEDHAIVGYDATILCHEFLQDEYRTGEVVIGERAMVGAGAIILPGVTVGENAQVAANSLVAEDVPPDTTVAGVPAEVVSVADETDGEDRTAEGS